MILDLTKPEGAKVIDENLFLYQYVKKVKEKIDEFLSYNDSEENITKEFFSTNIFINGKRGTGKTSVLLTVYNELKTDDSYRKSLEVLPIIDISTNFQSVLIYLLSYLKRYYSEKLETEACCEKNLYELLYKLEINFPILLKCICSSACEVICKEELHILLERNEINFLEELGTFISSFLKKIGKNKLVILIDDFDIPYDSKAIIRLLIELGVFLNHKDVIIIGAGDIGNLYTRLKGLLKEETKLDENNDNLESLVRSYVEKIFPLRNIITLNLIDIYFIANNVEIKWNNNNNNNAYGKLEDFLRRHPLLRKIFDMGYKDSIYAILDKQPVRTLVQTLKSIDDRIKTLEKFANNNNQNIFLKDVLISDVFISLALSEKHYVNTLETNVNIKAKVNMQNNEINIDIDHDNENWKNLYQQVWKIFKSFNEFLNNLFNDNFNGFIWRNLTEFRNYRFRFLDLVKVYNIRLYGALYIWMMEIFVYLGRYAVPLFMIVWNIIYGLPIILFKLFNVEQRDDESLFSAKDFFNIVNLDNFVEFDNSLNLIDHELREAKVSKDYKRFILFGKAFRYIRKGALQLHFYRFFLNLFISLFHPYLINNLTKRERYDLIIDYFSYGYDIGQELEEEETQEGQNRHGKGKGNDGNPNHNDKKTKSKTGYFQEIWKIYEKKLEYLREFQETLREFMELEPLTFDKVIFSLILRSKDKIFRERNYGKLYKKIFILLFPFVEFVSILNYGLYIEWRSEIFKKGLLEFKGDNLIEAIGKNLIKAIKSKENFKEKIELIEIISKKDVDELSPEGVDELLSKENVDKSLNDLQNLLKDTQDNEERIEILFIISALYLYKFLEQEEDKK